MIKYANNLSEDRFHSGPFKPKHKMSIDEAVMFVTFYEEDGIKGWRFPTDQESIDNPELTGCWYQEDLNTSWPPDECYFVRPVKDID
jgi:hypothetical protein